jgi:pre-60S factor REI1
VPSNSTQISSLGPDDQLYTCLSCNVAFLSPDEQRDHMRSDWHRYNMKVRPTLLDLPAELPSCCCRLREFRAADPVPSTGLCHRLQRRVATLPPVTAALFNRKVIERRNENAVTATKKGETCHLCV